MATDFRFNAQQSYSPLLAALAEAPLNKAKMQIAQETNQRQRLSDLLTNISSAAATARQFQANHQQAVEQLARENAAKQMGNSLNQNLMLGNPAFQQSMGGMAGTGAGIDQMFNSVPSNTAPSQPAQNGIRGIGEGLDPEAVKQKMKLKALGVSYHTETNPTTGEPYQVTDSPIGIPPEKINYPGQDENLPPIQKKDLLEHVGKFRSDPQYKTYTDQIQAARNLRNAVNSENPIARLNALAGQVRESGISRVTLPELQMGGHDPSAWESLKQKFETAATGKFTKVNKDELNSLADMIESTGKVGLGDLSASYSGDYKRINQRVPGKLVDDIFNNAISAQSKTIPSPKKFKKPQKSQGVDLGNGFSYTVK